MDRLKINSRQVRINLKPRRRLSRLNSKKRRNEDNLEQSAERITFDAVPGH